MKRRVLVVSLGNPLMSDDGAGYVAVEHLKERGVRAEHLGTDPLMLHSVYQGENVIIILDAAHGGINPGEIMILKDDEIFSRASAPITDAHHMGVVDALRIMRSISEVGRASVYMVLMGVERVEEGEGLSRSARTAVEKALKAVERIIGETET